MSCGMKKQLFTELLKKLFEQKMLKLTEKKWKDAENWRNNFI